MTFDIRGKYILSFLLLLLVTILVADLYLEYALGEWLESQLVAGLRRHANTGRTLVEAQEPPLTMEKLEPLVRLLGRDPELRITLVAADGQVLGDSQRDDETLRAMENHGHRPEVVAAMQEGFGQDKRYSSTLSKVMLYVAVPFHHPQGIHGVVRVAVGLESVQAVQHRLHWVLAVAGLIAIVTALLLSGFSAHWATHSQRHVIAYARGIARSTRAPRIEIHANDAMAELASSLNLLAEEKDETLARLSEQQSKMAAVLQSMGEGVIALDGQQCITLMNRSVLELLGLNAPLLGQPAASLLPAQAIAELGLSRVPLPVQPFSTEFDLEVPPSRRVMAVMTPLHEHQGHVIVLRDVTEKRRLDLVRRDFVANVSHELRTPVSVMQANAQTLLDGALEDPRYSRLLVDAMERNATRLARIIADLLDLSRLDANQLVMERHMFHLLPIVQEVVELLRRNANEKQITLQVEVAPEQTVYADTEALRRILTNFLDNGIKYVPNHALIQVRACERPGGVRLEVVDNGPGIAPQHRDRLFERFYRVDSGRSRKMGGTGLGLAIVKHLAENMGEQVGMEAVEPKGSLFWVTLSDPPV
ncbi:MAG: ATP-binding protein [Magnetococcus sp. MYC-9]